MQIKPQFEPWVDIDKVPAPEGAVVRNDGGRDFEVKIAGVRFEHVANAPDGRWIYAKSV
jgi:hypothetical protein